MYASASRRCPSASRDSDGCPERALLVIDQSPAGNALRWWPPLGRGRPGHRMARRGGRMTSVRTVRPPISTTEGGRVAAPKSSNAHHKMKGGEMPSPPDVILVLSPRTARLVQFAVQNLAVSPEFVDFDEEQEFADTGE